MLFLRSMVESIEEPCIGASGLKSRELEADAGHMKDPRDLCAHGRVLGVYRVLRRSFQNDKRHRQEAALFL